MSYLTTNQISVTAQQANDQYISLLEKVLLNLPAEFFVLGKRSAPTLPSAATSHVPFMRDFLFNEVMHRNIDDCGASDNT